MPAPIAPLLGFLLGVIFAWVAGDERVRATDAGGRGHRLTLVAVFSAVVFAPASGFFLAASPDWCFAYLVDSERLPRALLLALPVVSAASVPTGFLAATSDAGPRLVGRLLALAAPPALISALVVAGLLSRFSVDASYAQFHGGFGTRDVAGAPLGWALLWMNGVLWAAVAWTVHWLRRLS